VPVVDKSDPSPKKQGADDSLVDELGFKKDKVLLNGDKNGSNER
jgi:hypothetical protein